MNELPISLTSAGATLATEGCYCDRDIGISAKLQEKTARQNGEVTADAGYAGLSKVTVACENTPQDIRWHQCPLCVREFLEAADYASGSASVVADYAPASGEDCKPLAAEGVGAYSANLQPNAATPFVEGTAFGTLTPLDAVRLIATSDAPNVRDLGGRKCDGGTVRYGLLIRGGTPTANDRAVLVEQLGVRHDMNLRAQGLVDDTSPMGRDLRFVLAEDSTWYLAQSNDAWQINLRYIFDAVTHNEPLYFHCETGADGAGTLACVLEGLLGVSQADIEKDYELSSFCYGAGTELGLCRRDGENWQGLIESIGQYSGESFRDRCVQFVRGLGFTSKQINAFRAAMIDGTPDEIA